MIFESVHYPTFGDRFSDEDKKNTLAHLKSLKIVYYMVVWHRVLLDNR